jgi:hypothetical protein
VGRGLTPADGISVAPSPIPVPPTGVLASNPSGEVGLIGAGVSSTTWANAELQQQKAEITAMINNDLIRIPRDECIMPRREREEP